jgi:hypothetical protein
MARLSKHLSTTVSIQPGKCQAAQENCSRGDWFTVVMEQMGQELGLLFFDSLKEITALYDESDFDNPGAGAEHLLGVSFSLGEQF